MSAIFRISSSPPHAWLRIEGELDVVSRGPLSWRLLDLEQLDCSSFALDVGSVTHVDRCSMRLIDEARRRLLARGAAFHVSSTSACFALLTRVAGYTALSDPAAPETSATPRLTLLHGHRDRPLAG